MLPRPDVLPWPQASNRSVPEVLDRICVRPPYFNLRDLALEGLYLYATATAESPPFLELGPMPAAELGRHAAITGLAHAALSQRDGQRRYYLAKRAECLYWPNSLPYGTPIRFQSHVVDLGRRDVHCVVEARAGQQRLARFDLSYAILPAASFERLFRHRGQLTEPGPSPYGRLLTTDYQRGPDWVEQRVDRLPVETCAGHFESYPALPVAVLMGQLSYLAGQLMGDGRQAFRVLRGAIEADDLAWAGEPARFLVQRSPARAGGAGPSGDRPDSDEPAGERFDCSVHVDERRVGSMTLWLASVAEGEAGA